MTQGGILVCKTTIIEPQKVAPTMFFKIKGLLQWFNEGVFCKTTITEPQKVADLKGKAACGPDILDPQVAEIERNLYGQVILGFQTVTLTLQATDSYGSRPPCFASF